MLTTSLLWGVRTEFWQFLDFQDFISTYIVTNASARTTVELNNMSKLLILLLT